MATIRFAQYLGGVSAGPGSFLGVVSADPQAASNWNVLAAHLADDLKISPDDTSQSSKAGVASTIINAAVTFLQAQASFTASASGGSNADGAGGWNAALNLAGTNHTSFGSVQMVNSLLDAAKSPLSDAASHEVVKFTGSLISKATITAAGETGEVVADVGSGLMATGIGAVVGIGLEVIGSVLGGLLSPGIQPAGYIGSCPIYDHLPGTKDASGRPQGIVCRYAWTQYGYPTPGGPGAAGWRRFPDPIADPNWYAAQFDYTAGAFTPAGGRSFMGIKSPPLQPWSPPPQVTTQSPGKAFTPGVVGGSAMGPTVRSWKWSTPLNDDLWSACFTFKGDNGRRPVDQAFYDTGIDGSSGPEISVFRNLEEELTQPIILGIDPKGLTVFRDFQRGFVRAWKANREFQLNGLRPLPDWHVLMTFILAWNRSHFATSTMTIRGGGTLILPQELPRPVYSYVQYILANYWRSMTATDENGVAPVTGGGVLTLNTGALKPDSPTTAPPIQYGPRFGVGVKPTPPPKPKRYWGATLAGAAIGALSGGPVGLAVGAATGAAVDVERSRHTRPDAFHLSPAETSKLTNPSAKAAAAKGLPAAYVLSLEQGTGAKVETSPSGVTAVKMQKLKL
jgi:hypothetical protein